MHKSRSALLPSVPTMAEEGIAECEANTFFGLVAPAGTPAEVVDKLNKAINEELSTPGMQNAITALGSEVIKNSPAEFARLHRDTDQTMDRSRQGRRREGELTWFRWDLST